MKKVIYVTKTIFDGFMSSLAMFAVLVLLGLIFCAPFIQEVYYYISLSITTGVLITCGTYSIEKGARKK